MLTDEFIPVAFDQWYLRTQPDGEGRFYQKIAKQGPRKDMNHTTQGFYLTDAAGELLAFNNNRGPERIRALMKAVLKSWSPPQAAPLPSEPNPKQKVPENPPDGTVVIQVNTRVLDGYPNPENSYQEIMQSAIGRDNLWIFPSELQSLMDHDFPKTLAKKLVQFHAVDNTRGEPPMWSEAHIQSLAIQLNDKGEITGSVTLENTASNRRCTLQLFGYVTFSEGRLTQFDVVMLGQYSGQGKYTPGAPEGSFPIGVACRIAAADDPAFHVRPQALKAFGPGYLSMGN